MSQRVDSQAGPSRSRPTSPTQSTSGQTSTFSNRHVLESTKATELEMQLRRTVCEEGEIRHQNDDPDEGVEADGQELPVQELGVENGLGIRSRSKEKTIVVDLGNGPEDVILIDWAENDPEVNSHS
jgi:hypothetical protein